MIGPGCPDEGDVVSEKLGGRAAMGWVVVLVVGVGLLALAWPRVAAPFGDSDEGINGAVWATNSRALREAGVLDSRLGGRRLDGTSYATHPPAIVVSTAVAETVAGERAWATRAPAWIASLVSLLLLYGLARTIGVGVPAAAAASIATALTPMWFTYGFMLDTPVVAFPLGVAVLLVWYRRWTAAPDRRAFHPVAVGAVCAVAALAGWQAAVLTLLCGTALAARVVRRRPHAIREALPFLVGGLLGIALSLSWTWWVYGDFQTLGDKYFRRSGESSSVGVDDMVSFQIPWLVQLLALGLVGVGGSIVALWDRRFRPAAAMSLAIVVVYAVVFRQAAAGHQYWNYWALLPTAVGFAWAFDRLTRDLPARAVVPTFAAGCLALGLLNLLAFDDEALRYIDDGREVAEQLVAEPLAPAQPDVPYVGQAFRPDAWLRYYTERPPVQLTTSAQLDELAVERPDDLVVVLGWCEASDPAVEFCRAVVGSDASTADEYVAPRPWVGAAATLARGPG
jgi:hypothetical protein